MSINPNLPNVIGGLIRKTPLNENFTVLINNDIGLQTQTDDEATAIANRYTKAEVDAKDTSIRSDFATADQSIRNDFATADSTLQLQITNNNNNLQGQITSNKSTVDNHLSSVIAHDASDIVNDSAVVGAKVSDALNTVQQQVNALVVSGTTNTTIGVYSMTATGTNTLTSTYSGVTYFGGLKVNLGVTATNTGSTTLNINSLGVKTIKKIDGTGAKVNLIGGELRIGNIVQLQYDGTDFVLLDPTLSSSTTTITLDGTNQIKTTPDTYYGMSDVNLKGTKLGMSNVSIYSIGKNIFDGVLAVGTYDNTGLLINSDVMEYSINYTPVKANTQYTIGFPSGATNKKILFYTSAKVFISYTSTDTVTTPSNAKYMKFTYQPTTLNINRQFMVNEGSLILAYEPYNKTGVLINMNNTSKFTLSETSSATNELGVADISLQPQINDTSQYGIMWNQTDDIISRLGDNSSLLDFNNIYPWSNMRRCNIANDGTVLAYYGDSTYKEDGSNGQVMVEIPKVYYKYLSYTSGGKEYHEWWYSRYKHIGYEIDPAFIYGANEIEYNYIGAYTATIFDKSSSSYLLNDEQVADFAVGTGDLLCSISNAKPCSGLTQNLTLSNCRILANNRGLNWGLLNINQIGLLQRLFIIEYASFNSQSKIGQGVVNKTDDGATNMANKNGATSCFGNNNGRQNGTNGLTSVSYRGVENLWGNIWQFVDGINIQADNQLWINPTNKDMVSDKFTSPYILQGTLSNTNGYISKILNNKYGLFPIQNTGIPSTRIPDYYYQSTGNRIAFLGGGWHDVSNVGFAYLRLNSSSGGRNRFIGGRLAMLK